ncbi:hypothetical protein LTR53_006352 [Teratosphaeriaceae sp. CCFEE 6253]|nr:hypothetical protein LTR53_006352 [Teratosphaeriaceae sp. CCFEE 6253]
MSMELIGTNASRKRSRSRDRFNDSRNAKRHEHRHHGKSSSRPVRLPFHHLHKHDLGAYRSVFADYLDIQKGKDIADLSEEEVRGRWKSFLNKWNRGELAEGWYDPEAKRKADERYVTAPARPTPSRPTAAPSTRARSPAEDVGSSEGEDDGYGPALPNAARRKVGPSIPGYQDLQAKREQDAEDRDASRADARYERKQDSKLAQSRLDELAPRADPGSRERQLEKKREITAGNHAFRDAEEGGEVEVRDSDLLGDDRDGHKAELKQMEKKKNERELRKEEVLRARAVEREERLAEYRRKDDRTMDMLKEIAKQRFG